MDEVYNWGYYVSHCGENYEKAEFWEAFFGRFARLIVDSLNPRTVLDVGCATGYLVAALRDLGVEAWGMDISQAAISRGREDIRPYLTVHSLLDDDRPVGIPQKFDLVTNIEVLEHLYEDEVEKALAMLCTFSDHILFSSSPHDITEETHVNVRQPEYWVQLFAKQGFFRSQAFDATSVAPDSIYFTQREGVSLPRMVEDYEHQMRLLKSSWRTPEPGFHSALLFGYDHGFDTAHPENHQSGNTQLEWHLPLPAGAKKLALFPAHNRRCIAENLAVTAGGQRLELTNVRGEALGPFVALSLVHEPVYADLSALSPNVPWMLSIKGTIHILEDEYLIGPLTELRARMEAGEEDSQKLLALEEHLTHREKHIDQLTVERDLYKQMYESAVRSLSWKLTKPVRFVIRGGRGVVRALGRGIPGLRRFYPWFASVRHLGLKTVRFNQKHYGTLEGPRSAAIPQQAELEAQEQTVFSPPLVISVVCPLFNTPEAYLREMIQSLLGQSYPHWELCLADGSDAAHAYVGRVASRYARKDSRIRYQKLAENQGIAGNTNAALAMATGAYIGLLDHDDLLNLNALFEVRRAIEEQGGDFLYSDEVSFREDDLSDVTVVNHKPDFAPDTLRSLNYICHFTVFRRELLEKAGGGYNPAYEGSQDYDMVLRLTEQAEKIVHIPKLLYFWRVHQSSVAAGIEAKPYAVDSAKRAIAAHLSRVGLAGEVELAPDIESGYHIRYALEGRPKISIIIPNRDEADTLKTCLESLMQNSTYDNYEILLVENGSRQEETFEYYQQLKEDPRVRLLLWEEGFNYSAINNFAVSQATGEYVLLLNNDTEILTPGWLEEMLMFAQRPDVGAVGAKLYYPDDTLQHGGVVVGMGGLAAHGQLGLPRSDPGYMWSLKLARNVSCVTAACLMMRREVYEEVGGLNEKFSVAFNDVDLCMRVRKAGYLIVFTPFAELYHYESKSRGPDTAPDRRERFNGEVQRFQNLWAAELAEGDPYYNPNLSLDTTDIRFLKPL